MSADAQQGITPRAYVRALIVGALLGIPAAAAAVAFESLLHGATTLVWTDIPDGFGWKDPAWWYVVLVPALAGVLVALALRLPGHGGHSALQGMKLEPPRPVELVSILAAALITLAGGLVLGPEAPLMALGLALGAMAARAARVEAPLDRSVTLAGAFAALAALFGGPLVVVLFLFEMLTGSGKVPPQMIGRVLLPGFVAAGIGSLIFTGVDDWAGVHEQSLALPDLPAYPTVHLVDVAWSLPIAVVVAAVIVGVRRLARAGAPRLEAVGRPMLVLVVAGLAVGALAVLFRVITDEPIDFVLFSGEASGGAVLAEGSAGVLLAILAFKAVGYGISMAGGFRGGPIFPAVALGIAGGSLGAAFLPGLALAPAAVAGVAAAAASAVRLPVFGALLAALLAGSAASQTTPVAVLAAVTAWLVTIAIEPEPQAA